MDPEVKDLLDIMSRTGICYTLVAIAAGVGIGTAQAATRTGRLPKRIHSRRSLKEFVRLNAGAMKRGDLKFVDA